MALLAQQLGAQLLGKAQRPFVQQALVGVQSAALARDQQPPALTQVGEHRRNRAQRDVRRRSERKYMILLLWMGGRAV